MAQTRCWAFKESLAYLTWHVTRRWTRSTIWQIEKYSNIQPCKSSKITYPHCTSSVVVGIVWGGSRNLCCYDTQWRRSWSCRHSPSCPSAFQEVPFKTYVCKITFPNAQPLFSCPTSKLALQLRSTCYILSICGLLYSVVSATAAAEAVNHHSQEWKPCG